MDLPLVGNFAEFDSKTLFSVTSGTFNHRTYHFFGVFTIAYVFRGAGNSFHTTMLNCSIKLLISIYRGFSWLHSINFAHYFETKSNNSYVIIYFKERKFIIKWIDINISKVWILYSDQRAFVRRWENHYRPNILCFSSIVEILLGL